MDTAQIGIDIGTSTISISFINPLGVGMFSDEVEDISFPACIAFVDKITYLGSSAKRYLKKYPSQTIFQLKEIGLKVSELSPSIFSQYSITSDEYGNTMISIEAEKLSFTPQQLLSQLLVYCKSRITKALFFDSPKIQVSLSVPSFFSDSQRRMMEEAGTSAGLDVLRIVNDPTMVCYGYGLTDKEDEKTYVIIDIGNSCDVSILLIDEGIVEILGTSRDSSIGGELMTENLLKNMISMIEERHKCCIAEDLTAVSILYDACESAKCQLSTHSHVDLKIDIPSSTGDISFCHTLLRDEFERLNWSLFERIPKVIDQAFENVFGSVPYSKSDMNEIILAGGCCYIPRIKHVVRDYFDHEPLCSINPDEVIARGLAILSKRLSTPVEIIDESHDAPTQAEIEEMVAMAEQYLREDQTKQAKERLQNAVQIITRCIETFDLLSSSQLFTLRNAVERWSLWLSRHPDAMKEEYEGQFTELCEFISSVEEVKPLITGPVVHFNNFTDKNINFIEDLD
ncbi:Heat shock protein 70 family like protein [Aduncisulcus paluster]|uniref:Heat shock protein 70 family like protein n=1 Tax=Aduncisulcus paluster TaxID=2918883 RepID=A0ABQ5KM00_9EUKA|nr:Heat shock protein 70 family like protein [Aduncisulcus paluster]